MEVAQRPPLSGVLVGACATSTPPYPKGGAVRREIKGLHIEVNHDAEAVGWDLQKASSPGLPNSARFRMEAGASLMR